MCTARLGFIGLVVPVILAVKSEKVKLTGHLESWTLYTTRTTVEGFVPTLCHGVQLLHPTAEDRTSRAWKCSTS